MKIQDKLDAIRAVLMESWDPIGVKDEKAVQDEYDAYLSGILRLLEQRASVADLAKHLHDIATRDMGLVDVERRDTRAAEQLLRLRLQ